eukprot:3620014-Prymnesium_polylepis.2
MGAPSSAPRPRYPVPAVRHTRALRRTCGLRWYSLWLGEPAALPPAKLHSPARQGTRDGQSTSAASGVWRASNKGAQGRVELCRWRAGSAAPATRWRVRPWPSGATILRAVAALLPRREGGRVERVPARLQRARLEQAEALAVVARARQRGRAREGVLRALRVQLQPDCVAALRRLELHLPRATAAPHHRSIARPRVWVACVWSGAAVAHACAGLGRVGRAGACLQVGRVLQDDRVPRIVDAAVEVAATARAGALPRADDALGVAHGERQLLEREGRHGVDLERVVDLVRDRLVLRERERQPVVAERQVKLDEAVRPVGVDALHPDALEVVDAEAAALLGHVHRQ